jgi:hypothetical protein
MGKTADMPFGKPMGKAADLSSLSLGRPMGKMGGASLSGANSGSGLGGGMSGGGFNAVSKALEEWEECSGWVGSPSDDGARSYWLGLVRVTDVGLLLSAPVPVDGCDLGGLVGVEARRGGVLDAVRPSLRRLCAVQQELQVRALLCAEDDTGATSVLPLTRDYRLTSVPCADHQQHLAALAEPAVLRSRWLHSTRLPAMYSTAVKIHRLRGQVDTIRHFISNENLSLFPDFQQRLSLLQVSQSVPSRLSTYLCLLITLLLSSNHSCYTHSPRLPSHLSPLLPFFTPSTHHPPISPPTLSHTPPPPHSSSATSTTNAPP